MRSEWARTRWAPQGCPVHKLLYRFAEWLMRLAPPPPARRIKLPELSREERRTLMLALADHPGFTYLMAKHENQRHALEAQRTALTSRIKVDAAAEPLIRELIRTDEAIFRLGQIQAAVKLAGAMPTLRDDTAV